MTPNLAADFTALTELEQKLAAQNRVVAKQIRALPDAELIALVRHDAPSPPPSRAAIAGPKAPAPAPPARRAAPTSESPPRRGGRKASPDGWQERACAHVLSVRRATVAEVNRALKYSGAGSISNYLSRLAAQGRLQRLDDGAYAAPDFVEPP